MTGNASRRDATWRRRLKRAVDLIGASVALLILGPLMALIALWIRVADGPPVLFRQVRPGLHGHPFTILKFRTMREPRAGEVWYLTDDVRVTRAGALLRTTSLDELPELLNVLRGDMSLVGPRPLLVEYLASYTPEEHRRHDVRPGITGWAAVNGRHTLPFSERLRLDVWYVDHWSLRLDLRIIWLTIRQVIRREDVTATPDLSLGFRLPGLPEDQGRAEPPDPSGEGWASDSRSGAR